MTQTITTPVTHKFNSFEVLRDSALPLGTKATITLANNDVIEFDLVHKHAYGATNIFVIADCYGEHYMNRMLTNKGGYNESDMRRHLREDILPLIPDDLKKQVIISVVSRDNEVFIPDGNRLCCPPPHPSRRRRDCPIPYRSCGSCRAFP